MKDELQNILQESEAAISAALNSKELEELRISIFGKKGRLTHFLRGMGGLSAEERPVIGQMVNDIRESLTALLESKKADLHSKELAEQLSKETIDMTLPGVIPNMGHRHPMSHIIEELLAIFAGMGYSVAEGPDIENVYYNFEALNMDKDHPARDEQDTFYIHGTDELILRTQTSPVQIRKMEQTRPPIAIIAPGKVFRTDKVDATHSPVFHQLEGLVVDKNITMGHLKATLSTFAKELFGSHTVTRFRPHHFPFTEPSAEMDVSCFNCDGGGGGYCPVCKGEGFIELLGCGMVHPALLSRCGIDPAIYSGFAFGMGLERLAMQKYKIDDLRLLFENDVKFLKQF